MSLIYVDLRSRTPIFEQIIECVRDLVYEQIKDGFRKLIITNSLSANEKLPSVRELASGLAINPNTIQKAYGELERQGVIYSLAGRGNFVASDISALTGKYRAKLLERIAESIEAASEYGIERACVERTVERALAAYGGGDRI